MNPPEDNPDAVISSEILYGPNGEFFHPETQANVTR
jgi:hypothetical protein